MRGIPRGLFAAIATIAMLVSATNGYACSGGSCNKTAGVSGVSVDTGVSNASNALIDQQEQKVRELQAQIKSLSATLDTLRQSRRDRAIVQDLRTDDSIVNISRTSNDGDIPLIRPIQLLSVPIQTAQLRTAAAERAPAQVQVQAPRAKVQVAPQRTASRWNR